MKVEEIARTLIGRLESGVYGTGSRFPSEYRLAEEFSVDKATANKAVARLVGKGYLERGKQGSGTYVKQTRLSPPDILRSSCRPPSTISMRGFWTARRTPPWRAGI